MNPAPRLQLRRTVRITADAAGMSLGLGQMGIDICCCRRDAFIQTGIVTDELGDRPVLLIEDDRVFRKILREKHVIIQRILHSFCGPDFLPGTVREVGRPFLFAVIIHLSSLLSWIRWLPSRRWLLRSSESCHSRNNPGRWHSPDGPACRC